MIDNGAMQEMEQPQARQQSLEALPALLNTVVRISRRTEGKERGKRGEVNGD